MLRIQSDDSIMCGFYCIALIEYLIAGKAVLNYASLLSLKWLSKEWQDKIYVL